MTKLDAAKGHAFLYVKRQMTLRIPDQAVPIVVVPIIVGEPPRYGDEFACRSDSAVLNQRCLLDKAVGLRLGWRSDFSSRVDDRPMA